MKKELMLKRLSTADWQHYRVTRLASLKDSPDAFGSTHERELGFPDEIWQHRLAADPLSLPLGLYSGEEMIGLAAGRIHVDTPERVDVYQMWVAPSHRGRGGSRLLLNRILEWARSQHVTVAHLEVSVGNAAAESLYLSTGFVPCGDAQPIREGSSVLSQPMVLSLDQSLD